MPRARIRLISLLAAAAALLPPRAARPESEDPPRAPVGGAGAEAEKAKRLRDVEAELARNLGGMKTLRAAFVQRKRLEVFEEEVESRGTLALAVPGRLRWEVSSPVRTILVVDGDRALRARISRKGVRTASRFRLEDDPVAAGTVRQILLWMRGDLEAARREYDLELLEEAPPRIRAVPRSPELAKAVSAVEILFAEDRRSVREVALEEAAKSRTVIVFSDVERDPDLAADLFEIGQ